MLLGRDVREEFDARSTLDTKVEQLIKECADAYRGVPAWIDDERHIKTINFAESICSETALLTTLGIGVKIDGSARAEWLMNEFDRSVYYNLRRWTEYGCAYGTVIAKPTGSSVELVTPAHFVITDHSAGNVTGAVFESSTYDSGTGKYYRKLEYHRFEGDRYKVSNRCYVGASANASDKRIGIDATPWRGMAEDVELENIDRPLFGVFRAPHANNIDVHSPYGLPVFAGAMEELFDLDVAYSRNAEEIYDSHRTVVMDSDRLIPTGEKVPRNASAFRRVLRTMDLPDYVKTVEGTGDGELYHEINPSLQTDTRLTGINALLSQIGYKCGYSNGHFVFNEKSGMATATEVESNDRRTIQFIKDMRDRLEYCLDGLIYALDKFADLYDLAPVGAYETVYDFGDITYNRDEDRSRWFSYVVSGKVPFWYFLTKFEGFTEDEAKEIEDSAGGNYPALFEGEE